MKYNKETLQRRSSYFIFWSWHLVYVVFALAVLAPYILVPLLQDIINSSTPVYYALYPLSIMLLPFVSIYLGFFHFRKNYRVLMKYFYGFEMPALSLILIKILTLRELNTAMSFLIISTIIVLATWFYFLWEENKHTKLPKRLKKSPIALSGAALITLAGLYFGALILLLNIPLAMDFFSGLFSALSRISFSSLISGTLNPLVWVGVTFAIYTMTLFIILPVALVWLYTRQIKLFSPFSSPLRIAIIVGVFVISASLFSFTNQQPQKQAFALLDNSDGTTASSLALLKEADIIKKGLLNAYLWPSRYVNTSASGTKLNQLYKRQGFHPLIAQAVQSSFNFLIHPTLYDGSYSDQQKANDYYEKFFDSPIQKAEQATILNSLSKHWEVGRNNEAGLLAAEQKYVHVSEQSISLSESNGVATITVSEVLENTSPRDKEAVIHFSLPRDAVITGLWLSTEKNNPKMFPYVLAPKGAAQAVYKTEVKRRVDPALLEQTGPNQYRLRAYPILAKRGDKIPYFHMQLEYQTIANTDNQWPLPKVLEQRNIYWDGQTQRRINGDPVGTKVKTQWIPSQLSSVHTTQPSTHTSLVDNQIIKALKRNHAAETPKSNKHIAVLIDGSYSMHKLKEATKQAYEKIPQHVKQADFYYCHSTCTALENMADLQQQFTFGNSQVADHIAAFNRLQHPKYDAILVLTDDGSYEIESTEAESLTLSTPLWITHLEGHIPYAYDDRVLDLIYKTHGGITYSIKEALLRLNTANILQAVELQDLVKIIAITENHIWVETTNHLKRASGIVHNKALQKIIAHQKIKQLTRTMDMNKLDNLDKIHQYAKENGIVTHYSSMLVLVNERQKEALHKAEQKNDRFEREVETGKTNSLFSITAVPEPEEWALLIIISLLLSAALLRRRDYRTLK